MTASACLKETVPLEILNHCKFLPEIMMAPLKSMAASAFLKYKSALNRNIYQIRFIYATAASFVQRWGVKEIPSPFPYCPVNCECSWKKAQIKKKKKKLWLQLLIWEIAYPLRNGWPQLLSWNKETLHSERNCYLQIITVTYKLKMFLGTTTLFWIRPFSYEALLIISLKSLYICQ